MKMKYILVPLGSLSLLPMAGCPEGSDANSEMGYESTTGAEQSSDVAPSDRHAKRHAMLERVLAEEPSPEQFEFIGLVERPNLGPEEWPHGRPADASSVDELLTAKFEAEGIQGSHDGDENSKQSDVARGVLASIDGRVYLERRQFVARRRMLPAAPEGRSRLSWEEPDEPGAAARSEPENEGFEQEDDVTFRDNIPGSDGRSLIRFSSSNYPHRAVGVQLMEAEGAWDPPHEENDTTWGSGAMISPRAVLTAGHVTWGLYNDVDGDGAVEAIALPGGRSTKHSGNSNILDGSDTPFGMRNVVWFYWPVNNPGANSCADPDIRFDYGVLILEDLPSSPGYISFGYNSNAVAQDWSYYNMSGYPGYTNRPRPEGEGLGRPLEGAVHVR